ncbi:MAG TPA: hypothetical protein VNZ53_04145 [Steroidobacteraceae bacterium]|jgi:hypothetical protein|nr:hypothetical protein [Steroidobacteraceae bacterium]
MTPSQYERICSEAERILAERRDANIIVGRAPFTADGTPVLNQRERDKLQTQFESIRDEVFAFAKRDLIVNQDQQIVHRTSGVGLETWLDQQIASRPFWQPQAVTDLAEQAFGDNPSLKARGQLLKEIGADAFAEEQARWGANAGNLKPGTKPTNGADKTTPKSAATTNPFKLDPRDPRRDKAIAALMADAKLPSRVKVGMAKAAGCQLNGKPL